MESLLPLLARSTVVPRLAHLLDFQRQGVPDQEWVSRYAREGWILISTDRGKRAGGEKITLLCTRYRMTHILMSATLHRRSSFEKMQAIIGVWADIAAAADAIPGTRYSLRLNAAGTAAVLIKLSDGPADATP